MMVSLSIRPADSEALECTICYDEKKEAWKGCSSGHLYHSSCLQKWVASEISQKSCPTCREDLSKLFQEHALKRLSKPFCKNFGALAWSYALFAETIVALHTSNITLLGISAVGISQTIGYMIKKAIDRELNIDFIALTSGVSSTLLAGCALDSDTSDTSLPMIAFLGCTVAGVVGATKHYFRSSNQRPRPA